MFLTSQHLTICCIRSSYKYVNLSVQTIVMPKEGAEHTPQGCAVIGRFNLQPCQSGEQQQPI